jgi:galactokinase/mevalonate kinase-like predicted kinase
MATSFARLHHHGSCGVHALAAGQDTWTQAVRYGQSLVQALRNDISRNIELRDLALQDMSDALANRALANFSPDAWRDLVESVFELGLKNGAVAGKVSGAGGGGFVMFMVNPELRHRLVTAMNDGGIVASPVQFTEGGAEAWTSSR